MERDSKQVLTELLVYQAQAGDERAFASLFELWRDDFERFATALVQAEVGGEEVAQEGWVSIARGIKKLDDPERFRAWAFSILRRRAADWIRKRRRERKPCEQLAAEAAQSVSENPTESERVAQLREAVQELDTESRQLLRFFYELGLSVSELAIRMGIAEGTVKSRLHAVREKLKRKVERKRQ